MHGSLFQNLLDDYYVDEECYSRFQMLDDNMEIEDDLLGINKYGSG